VLRKVLIKYGVEDKIASCMKTTVSVYKSHYLDIINNIKGLSVLSSNDFDVKDIFYHEFLETKNLEVFGQKVSAYI